MFNTIDEALNWLYGQRNPVKDKSLKRIKSIIKDLQLEPNYKIISIAGTNGKGSISLFIKNIIKNIGKHAGMFTSPFIISFNERIQINDRLISNAEIIHYLNILESYSIDYKLKFDNTIPFFELTFLMALMFFKDRNIDVAVLECGIGGLYDAVNALEPDISVIASIGFDHQNVLGNSLDEIFIQKLGIARNDKPLVLAMSCIEDVPMKYIIDNKIKLYNIYNMVNDIKVFNFTDFIYNEDKYRLKMLGDYQAYNASIAIKVCDLLYPNINKDLISYSLYNSFLPGRFEIISNEPLIILDGAHNISAIENISRNIVRYKKRINVLFNALKDKEYDKMLNLLDSISYKFYFIDFDDNRKVDTVSFINYISKPYEIIENINEIRLDENDLLLVTGSLHFISSIRKKIINQ